MAKLDDEDRGRLPDREFAFPEQRKEPLEDASHVRNAVARFSQVEGVSDAERDKAWRRIEAAAKSSALRCTNAAGVSWTSRTAGEDAGSCGLATVPCATLRRSERCG